MKIHAKIFASIVCILACSLQMQAQLGSQGVRQEVASLTDICTTQFSVIESLIENCCTQLDSQLDTIGSKLDLPSCAATPITTSTTLSTPGAYCLANNISGDVAITGTNITLDLSGRTISGGTYGIIISGNNVTIKNGTVRNATQSGIKILSGSNCVLEQIITTSNTKGFELSDNASNNTFVQCAAFFNTSAGFYLNACNANIFNECQAVDNGGSADAYGFFSSAGSHNTFNNCIAKDTFTSGISPFIAAGFRFMAGEVASEICHSCVNNTFGNGLLKGILLDIASMGTIAERASYTFTDSGVSFGVAWIKTGTRYFVAAVDQTNTSGGISVNEFDPVFNTLNQIASFTFSSSNGDTTMISVAWHPIGADIYLATGGLWGDFNDASTLREVGILKFDPSLPLANRLTEIVTYHTGTGGTLGLDWLASGTHNYLATGGAPIAYPPNQGSIQVLDFDPVTPTITFVAEFMHSNISDDLTFSVAWQVIAGNNLLAIGGIVGTGGWGTDNKNIRILKLDTSSTPTLLEQTSFLYSNTGVIIQSVAWDLFTDGNYYLAVAGTQGTGVLAYNAVTPMLMAGPVAFTSPGSSSVAWLPGTPTYLVTNAGTVPSNNVRFYAFVPSMLVQDASYTYSSSAGVGTPLSVAVVDSFVAIGGDNNQLEQLQVINFTAGQLAGGLNCVIKDNVVHGIMNGAGYELNACENLFIDNIVYACAIDYNFTPSSCTGINIHSQLDVIESKLGDCCTQIDSQFNNIDSKIDLLESKLDLPSCAATPITASTIISTPGAYCLANNINGDLAITGTGITLDLSGRTISGGTYGINVSGNQITIRNGTIANALLANILLAGNNCLLENVDLVGSATGLYLLNGMGNRIYQCCAVDNTAAGFALQESFTNNIVNCKAVATSGSANTYGFVASSGGANVFQSCKAEGTVSLGGTANGFYIGDNADNILANLVTSAQSPSSFACNGIILPSAALTLAAADIFGGGSRVYAIAWSPDGRYLAVGGTGPSSPAAELQLFSFNGTSLTLIASDVFTVNGIHALSWTPDGKYLAAAGADSDPRLNIYAFNGTPIMPVVTSYTGSNINFSFFGSVDWSPDGFYLALGESETTFIPPIYTHIFAFDRTTSSLTPSTEVVYSSSTPSSVQSVDWSPNGNYLAIGGYGADANFLQIFAFDRTASSLNLVLDQSLDTIYSVNWSPNGSYLAVNASQADFAIASVYTFNATASTLSLITQYTYASGLGVQVYSVNWSPDGNYLAIGGNNGGLSNTVVLSFNGSTLTPVSSFNFGTEVNSVNWSPVTQYPYSFYLAIGGYQPTSGYQVQVYQATFDVANCVVQDNLVTGVRSTSGSTGIGYNLNACNNLVIDNTAYNNNLDYGFTTTCSGENIHSQLDVIESKISLPSCAATPITASTIISTPGAYCLANNISGNMAITGTDITLDLSGRTISGGTYGLDISGDEITVRNGTIKNAIQADIRLTGNKCLLESVDLLSSVTGLLMLNASRNRIYDCCALGNTAAGFALLQSSTNNIINCKALSNTGAGTVYGFVSQSGLNNLFDSCKAEATSSTSNRATDQAAGIALRSENASRIIASKIFDTITIPSAIPYGILLTSTTPFEPVFQTTYGTILPALPLSWSPNGNYLAVGGKNNTVGNDLQIYTFVNQSLTLTTSQASGSTTTQSVDWSPNGLYLAVGTGFKADGYDTQVYAFTGTSLVMTASALYSSAVGNHVNSVNWSPDGNYLAIGSQKDLASDDEIRVYAFTGTALVITTSIAGPANQVQWSPNGQYLAVSASPTPKIRIYSFNRTNSTLTFTSSYNSDTVNSIDWSPDGHHLAASLSGATGYLSVFSFTSPSLSFVTSMTVGTQTYFNANWSPNGLYLAAAGTGATQSQIQIFLFNNNSLILTSSYSHAAQDLQNVAWAPTGNYLAAGGGSPTFLGIFGFSTDSTNAIIQNNVVSGVHNSSLQGIGYYLNPCANLAIDNTAYRNDTDYAFTSTVCAPEDLHSQVDALESKLDACCTGLNSNIEWIVQYLSTH